MLEFTSPSLQAAARVLNGEAPAPADGEVRVLLDRLGEDDAGRAPLLAFAARLERLFEWPLPDAPGGCFVGGEADPARFGLPRVSEERISIGAAGASFADAFVRCAGEGIEVLSQIRDGSEATETLSFAALAAMHGAGPAGEMARLIGQPSIDATTAVTCLPARRIGDDRPMALPLDLCLRTPEARLRAAASTGCAAGPTAAEASLAGLLELVERDAAALWWVAGQPAREVPPGSAAMTTADRLLGHMRGGAPGRRTRLLDISSDVGVPVVAAVSGDARGRGFACGLGAGLDMASAAAKAVLELCQMELAQRVAQLKLAQRGPDALNATDRSHLVRGERLRLDHCPRLVCLAAKQDSLLDSAPLELESASAPGRWIGQKIASVVGCWPIWVDISRARLGIAAAKVVAAGLQPFPASVSSDRLSRAQRLYGGSLSDCDGIGLL